MLLPKRSLTRAAIDNAYMAKAVIVGENRFHKKVKRPGRGASLFTFSPA